MKRKMTTCKKNDSAKKGVPSANLPASPHPEDLIFGVKTFVNQLSEVQNEKFENLCAKISMNEIGKDWLFDYVYNCEEPLCFDEYLAKYGVKYADCVFSAGRS